MRAVSHRSPFPDDGNQRKRCLTRIYRLCLEIDIYISFQRFLSRYCDCQRRCFDDTGRVRDKVRDCYERLARHSPRHCRQRECIAEHSRQRRLFDRITLRLAIKRKRCPSEAVQRVQPVDAANEARLSVNRRIVFVGKCRISSRAEKPTRNQFRPFLKSDRTSRYIDLIFLNRIRECVFIDDQITGPPRNGIHVRFPRRKRTRRISLYIKPEIVRALSVVCKTHANTAFLLLNAFVISAIT